MPKQDHESVPKPKKEAEPKPPTPPKRKYEKWVHEDGTPFTPEERAARHRENMRQAEAAKTAAANDIGEIPPIVNPERRESCRFDLMKFGETYHRSMFEDLEYKWAGFHYEMVETLQRTVLEGGLFAEALPRGSGKTSWLEVALIWGGLYGHLKYAVLVDATNDLALSSLDSAKTQLEVQELLYEDFPEVVFPIRLLERKASKCNGQRYKGQSTRISWGKKFVVLPTIPGSESSGYRIGVSGITGSGLRGLVFSDSRGRKVRPDAAFINDFQTDRSAVSRKQTNTRLDIIRGAICGMGGPGKQISVCAAVTVQEPNDGADQMLEWPDWQGLRHGVLHPGLPKNLALWKEYREIQKTSLLKKRGTKAECDFYLANFEAMNEGTEATWPDRYNRKTERSGIQAAMNIFFSKGPKAFWSEFMNRPESAVIGDLKALDANDVRQRMNGLKRYEVPLGFDTITVGVDVQQNLVLYWVTAWRDNDFTGSVIDYGFLPAQDVRNVRDYDELTCTIQSESGADAADVDAAVSWALHQLGELVLDRDYIREDGQVLNVKRCHIDVHWQPSESAVSRFCRLSKWKSICYPARGQNVTSTKKRISSWTEKPGEKHPPRAIKRQCEWMITSPKKHLICEVYHWKAHWQSRMMTAFGKAMHSPGSISFYGNFETDPEEHVLASEHLTAHYPSETKLGTEEFISWVPKVGGGRWDLLDCLINSAVAASVEKIQLQTEVAAQPPKPKPKPRRTIEAEYL